MIRAIRGLPRTVWLLGLISLINDSASDLIYPLLPLYLTSVLLAGPKVLGLIEGVAEAAGSLLKLVAGVLADRTRSVRYWVIGGYGLAGAARPLIALSTSPIGVFACRVADRIGKGLRTAPRDALLSHSVTADQRGLAFGLHRAMDNFGAVLGPLLAGALLALGYPLRSVILGAFVPAVVVVGLAIAIPEPARQPERSPFPLRWRLADLPRVFRRYLVVIGLFTLGNSSNMFLLLRARELGVAPAEVPILWALTAFVAAAGATPLSALSDRWGRRRLLIAGFGVYAGVYLLFGLLPAQPACLWPMFAIYGLFLAATEGVERAMVADLVPAASRGSGFGWYHLVSGACLLPASLVFGALWAWFAPWVAFAFGASCAFAAAVLLATWVRPDRYA
jgi:MFS family permease